MKKTLLSEDELPSYEGFAGGVAPYRKWRAFDDAKAISAHHGKPCFVWYDNFAGWCMRGQRPSAELYWEVMGNSVFCCEAEVVLPASAQTQGTGATQ